MEPLRRLLSPSTRRFLEEADRTPGFGAGKRLHGYVYLRWPYLYIRLLLGEHPVMRFWARLSARLDRLFPGRVARRRKARRARAKSGGPTFADTYHAKVLPTSEAVRLVKIDRPVALTLPETVLPYSLARDVVLKEPEHIVVFDCPCRAAREHPCLPMDVCLVVGEPFAGFVLEHHAARHARRITPDEAVAILKAEDARGHVHHAFFKDAALGRFYTICNCCPCCCGAMQAQRNGLPMLASSGFVATCDAERCVGCGNCARFCPFGALSVRDRRLYIKAGRCMGCGVCVSKCPKGALSLTPDPARGMPLLVDELLAADKRA